MRMKRIMKEAVRKFVWLCWFIIHYVMFDRIIREENRKAEQRYREQEKIE